MSLMTGLRRASRASTAVGLLVVLVLLVALVVAVHADRNARGLLNPVAVDGSGSRAVAELLRDQGVEVEVARQAATVRAAGPDATVFLAFPDRLAPGQLAAARASAADLVLVAPDESPLRALTSAVEVSGSAPVTSRPPRCELPAAQAAGSADLGGALYRATGTGAVSCYPGTDSERDPGTDPERDPGRGGAALITLPDQDRTISIVGTPEVFTNDRLAENGNAALALRLLGGQPRLLWYLPPPQAAAPGEQRSFIELVPPGWLWGAAQLAIAVVLAALWRARRLGPVVAEPLPVVVRAAEAVEGQGRLYRRARAGEHAATALREGVRSRLQPLLGVPSGAAPDTVAAAVAARTGRPAAEVSALLYGAAPTVNVPTVNVPTVNVVNVTDAALVRLADQLDALEKEVRRS